MVGLEGVLASEVEVWAGNRVGVVADVKVLCDDVGPGIDDRIWRAELRSC